MSEQKLKLYARAEYDYVPVKDFQVGIAPECWNEDIVDITGYVPLDLRLKEFERAGIRSQLQESDFSISELRQIYDNHEFEYSPDDDLEDMIMKDNARKAYLLKLAQAKKQSEDSAEVKDVPKDKDENKAEDN